MNRRLLGCAFAAADLLFELDPDQKAVMAVGAGSRLIGRGEAELVGSDWRDWLRPADREMASSFIDGIHAGERRGPLELKLKGRERTIQLTAIAMPELWPNISCAFSLGARGGLETARGVFGLHDLDSFEAATERLRAEAMAEGGELDLALVQISLPADEADPARALARLAGLLKAQAVGGAAAQIGEDRFAVVRDASKPDRLQDEITKAIGVEPQIAHAKVTGPGSSRYLVGAIRSALRRFSIADGDADPVKVVRSLEAEIIKVGAHAERFRAAVENRTFKLVYQPIVALDNGVICQYEALVRFEDDESPAEAIRLAEELDLMEAFDLAVVRAALGKLREKGAGMLKLAVNMSARSLMSESFFKSLMPMLSENRDLDPPSRLSFEITETSQFAELAAADRQIQRLRRLGYRVALDDLGAGAASLSYLRALRVDAVKIDGDYIRQLPDEPRNEAVLRHLIGLCRELGLTTTAEMVESAEIEAKLKLLGVDRAQGWLYGKAESQPQPLLAQVSAATRRVGEVVSWG